MDIRIICKDKDTEIEKAFGLDTDSLERKDWGFFTATKDGEIVELYCKKGLDDNIIFYKILTKKDYEFKDIVKQQLKEFIDFLSYNCNHGGYYECPENAIWEIRLLGRTVKFPMTFKAYDELSCALEHICLDMIEHDKDEK